MQLTCRFYKNNFPETEDLVMVNVTEIEEMGVYVNLLEYNNRQGMILLTELSRRRIRSINKLIRVGRNEVVVVVRVDRDKGYIDLSKRRVSPEDISKCEEKFVRGKTVNSILRHTAEVLGIKTNEEFEELYEKTAWFYDEKCKRPGAAYDIFVRAVSDEHELNDCQVDENTKKILINNIRRRLTPQAVKCRADVEVACYGYEGVDAVKAALREGLSASTEEMPVKINLIAPPLYVVTATCLDRNEGLNALKKVIEKIKLGIEQYRGIFKIKMEPKVVTDVDDAALQEAMFDAEQENAERPGDDNEDSDEDEDGGIKGKLAGEDDDESAGAAKESKTTSQKTTSRADEDDDDEDQD
ncbi:unnamed protein product [Rotaria magnacalcarata]|uniref:Eukaryotic translation initiation factor 2 subunit 1 n=2 Tax=Rotaria magnacalcarata TaxID=392030 RepID=A0A816HJF9_9BILA|nr:unnamed protein product [Rotaria magnacalcarata]CAF1686651.1 unnamed protein product [Rotaria magnacalcarata]CAF1922364.1 unnamed protein product [Rotaria magnacalcarata]CAF2029519.1 unnamed protein product [Rotaria magnacalcarata]CAF2095850.1 unnamed protein product [Rotaria magnacalcarata]